MTLLLDIIAIDKWNATQIWGLKEADIATATGTDFVTVGKDTYGAENPDTPSLGMASFKGVDQTNPIKDSDTDAPAGIDPTVTGLTIDTDDAIVGSFTSTSGNNTTSWDDELATPDSAFAVNIADDPSEGAYKIYTGSDTVTGVAGCAGGAFNRKVLAVVILAQDA